MDLTQIHRARLVDALVDATCILRCILSIVAEYEDADVFVLKDAESVVMSAIKNRCPGLQLDIDAASYVMSMKYTRVTYEFDGKSHVMGVEIFICTPEKNDTPAIIKIIMLRDWHDGTKWRIESAYPCKWSDILADYRIVNTGQEAGLYMLCAKNGTFNNNAIAGAIQRLIEERAAAKKLSAADQRANSVNVHNAANPREIHVLKH